MQDKEKEFKDLWIVTHLSSFYSRRWRKNNFLRKSPDDTKKEDNDEIADKIEKVLEDKITAVDR